MCIKNWLRRLFRRRREGDPIRVGNATAWPIIGEKKIVFPKEIKANKLISSWAKQKIDMWIGEIDRKRR